MVRPPNLKPAVNRQPLFPRGGPEELAEQHNATTQSECEDNCRKHSVVSHKQQVSFRTQCFSFLCTALVFADTANCMPLLDGLREQKHYIYGPASTQMFQGITCAARDMTRMKNMKSHPYRGNATNRHAYTTPLTSTLNIKTIHNSYDHTMFVAYSPRPNIKIHNYILKARTCIYVEI